MCNNLALEGEDALVGRLLILEGQPVAFLFSRTKEFCSFWRQKKDFCSMWCFFKNCKHVFIWFSMSVYEFTIKIESEAF